MKKEISSNDKQRKSIIIDGREFVSPYLFADRMKVSHSAVYQRLVNDDDDPEETDNTTVIKNPIMAKVIDEHWYIDWEEYKNTEFRQANHKKKPRKSIIHEGREFVSPYLFADRMKVSHAAVYSRLVNDDDDPELYAWMKKPIKAKLIDDHWYIDWEQYKNTEFRQLTYKNRKPKS